MHVGKIADQYRFSGTVGSKGNGLEGGIRGGRRKLSEDVFEPALRDGVITPEMLEALRGYALNINITGKPSKRFWDKALEHLKKNGALSQKEIQRIKSMLPAMRSRKTVLKKKLKATEKSRGRLKRELGSIHAFLAGFAKMSYRLEEAAYLSALQATAGAGFGPAGVVAAYAAVTHSGQARLEALVEQLNKLKQEDPEVVLSGNEVTPVYGEDVWLAKMKLLDEAIASAESGAPVEIDAQYYDLTNNVFLRKLIKAARLGCPVRVNVDPSKAREGGQEDETLHMDDAPKTFRSLIALSRVEGADIGISVYPVSQQLGSKGALMHRKLLRVGDKVLLSGMNANSGSGENVDSGWIIRGPAAKMLVEGFARDVKDSIFATKEDIYSQDYLLKVYGQDLVLTPHGLAALLDSFTEDGTAHYVPYEPTYSFLSDKAHEVGIDLEKLVGMSTEELKKVLRRNRSYRQRLPLSEEGKKLLYQQLATALRASRHPSNVQRLLSISYPSGKKVGKSKVAIADLPTEREALVLHAIASAEEYIYIPAFVLTRPVAKALAAKKAEMKRKGKAIDIRVVVDSGIYPYGGTPNEEGVIALENAGIPVRWALLPRSVKHHDRKIHAKQIITDKMELGGSTNFSHKGLNTNWEVSAIVLFDEDDPDSLEQRERSRQHFLKLWENESFVLDTKKTAMKELAGMPESSRQEWLEPTRRKVIRHLLKLIRNFELEAADFIQEQLRIPGVGSKAAEFIRLGYAPGYAKLMAVKESLGEEEFYQRLHKLPSMSKLRSFRRYG